MQSLYDDGLLDVDQVETIHLHMMSLLVDSIPCLGSIHDELVYDANIDVLLLADSNDALHDVDRDSNIHSEVANDATLPLGALPSDVPIPLLGCLLGTPDEVVQRCCRQLDVEVHDDECSMLMQSLLALCSRCHARCVMSSPHL